LTNSNKRLINPNEIMVSVVCTTYNHEVYVVDAIEGFLMQKTTFPIEIIIHDDASTDKTADIIYSYAEKHPDRIVPILQKTNQFTTGIGVYRTHIWPKVRGKYIAMCEGDDFWIDPFKLQKQVDFLEENTDYVLTFAEFISVDGDGNPTDKCDYFKGMRLNNNINGYYFPEYIENGFVIHPVTVCFRRSLFDLFTPFSPYSYDVWLFERILFYGKIYKFDEVQAVYRDTQGSITKSEKHVKIVHKGSYDNLKYFSNQSMTFVNKKKVKIALFKRTINLMGSPFLSKKEKLGLVKFAFINSTSILNLIKMFFKSKKLKRIFSKI
jgi:glycosyltransferase involved in cell wall biosynthesis